MTSPLNDPPDAQASGPLSSEPRLEGWKAIAAHLSRSVRTAQNWANDRALPVRKIGGVAVAYPSELDQWLRTVEEARSAPVEDDDAPAPLTETPPAPPAPALRSRVPRYVAFLTTAAAVLCLAWFAVWFGLRQAAASPVPAAYSLQENALIVSDSAGHLLWRVTLPDLDLKEYRRFPPEDASFGERFGLFATLDGERRFLFTLYSRHREQGTTLFCFHPNGKIAWERKFGRAVTTIDGSTIFPIYDVTQMAVLRHPRPDGGEIVILSHHNYTWVANLAVLTSAGQEVAEYWHPGWLYKLALADWNGDGREEIFAGGLNDGYIGTGYGPDVVALDSRRISGQTAASPTDTRHQIRGVPPADEDAVLLFPDFDRTHPDPNVNLRVSGLKCAQNFVEVEISSQDPAAPNAHYELGPQLRVRSITPDPHTILLAAPGVTGPRSIEITRRVLSNVLTLRDRFLDPRLRSSRVAAPSGTRTAPIHPSAAGSTP